jgi:hypothetical protein
MNRSLIVLFSRGRTGNGSDPPWQLHQIAVSEFTVW